jgi:hypothetical protein
MIERFLLHRIHVLADGTTIDQCVERSFLILTHLANAAFAVGNHTVMRTQITAHAVLLKPLKERGFFHFSSRFVSSLLNGNSTSLFLLLQS